MLQESIAVRYGVQKITISDLNTTINCEPRILDVRLAEFLGFKKPRDIRELLTRHMPSLKRFGEVTEEEHTYRGKVLKRYYLNEKQSTFLCSKSDTESATDVTIQMVEVFYAHRHRLTEPLPHNQAIEDRQALEETKEAITPEAERITATQATKRMEKTHGDIVKASEVMAHLATGKRALPPELMEWLARELLRKITLSCACMEILTARIR